MDLLCLLKNLNNHMDKNLSKCSIVLTQQAFALMKRRRAKNWKYNNCK